MILTVNMLIEWVDCPAGPQVERILWIAPSGAQVVTIAVDARQHNALPKWRAADEIHTALTRQSARMPACDPYAHLLRPDPTIPAAHRARRDAAWALIAPLVAPANLPQLFDPARRGALIRAQIDPTRRRASVYTYLRRYWQAGQTKNALLPRYAACGGQGARPIDATTPQPKRGRPNARAQADQQPSGVNITATDRQRFRLGIQKFFATRQELTLKAAYQRTMETYYSAGTYQLENSVVVPRLLPADQRPTYGQFWYWYHQERNPTEILTAREGERRFALRRRALLGDSTALGFGPGSLYQIDATIGDLYLVSSLDPTRLIGRPVIYLIVDVFSRMIVGFSVSLEGPSWLGMLLALENMATDKVPFCREYGIAITDEQWPCHYLPEALLGDRGELVSQHADHLASVFNITVQNAAPYRCDWKGIVERHFRVSNQTLIHWMPGAVYPPRERGQPDSRLDACLTLHQFRQLLIRCVLYHNTQHYMEWYRLDEFMIADHVERRPIDLWAWGIPQRTGHLRTTTPDVLRMNLLPTAEVAVTAQGLRFRGLLYSCERALQEQWFVQARERRGWTLPVTYDPRLIDVLYLRLAGDRRLEPCRLLEHDQTWQGRSWYERLDYLACQHQASGAHRATEQQATAELNAHIQQIVSQAQDHHEQAAQAQGPQSHQARVQHIQQNRQQERAQERAADARRYTAEVPPATQAPAADAGDYIPPPADLDELRRRRELTWQRQGDSSQ